MRAVAETAFGHVSDRAGKKNWTIGTNFPRLHYGRPPSETAYGLTQTGRPAMAAGFLLLG